MVNIYDTANQLEEDLQQTSEFLALKGAYAKIKLDPLALAMFKKFQQKQIEFQKKQANGTLKDEDINQLKDLGERVQKNPLIVDLMQKEQGLAHLLDEISQIMFKPVDELYHD
ncbi:YlbF family regulator [Liquorilactobacillus sicerae]|uniref:YlbF family regulator n=1 Tax=Liquorilactobacillus sicerae TaxID=1416943 RepID=UPI00248030EB|nr:YlbF family regulator [Liquorilactobacillus sicerae]